MMNLKKRIELTRNALIGQAVGDAFGVPVEFLSREQVRRMDVREMIGSDSDLPPASRWGDLIPAGTWSDDTSMTVASMASVIRTKGGIDYTDQLAQFVNWWDKGEYCCLSRPFGLGGNVSASLQRFRAGTPALDCGGKGWMDNGNGALMRILPFSLYCIFNGLERRETMAVAGKGSAITHGHEISRACCFIWTEFLKVISQGFILDAAVRYIEHIPYFELFSPETVRELSWLADQRMHELTGDDIDETGYVVDTLYTALYSLLHAQDYETSIRNAVNLGYDTDTAAAVTGTAAGMLYGVEGIPERWLEKLKKRKYLESMAKEFAESFADQ